jgi:hypothetical protein
MLMWPRCLSDCYVFLVRIVLKSLAGSSVVFTGRRMAACANDDHQTTTSL